jgi:hypothetical protein
MSGETAPALKMICHALADTTTQNPEIQNRKFATNHLRLS